MGSVRIRDIAHVMDIIAPEDTAADFDNVGLLVGDPGKEVTGIAVALDVDGATVGHVGEQEHFARYLVDQRRLVERGRFLALRQRQAEFAYVEYIHMDAFIGRSDSSRPSLCRSR